MSKSGSYKNISAFYLAEKENKGEIGCVGSYQRRPDDLLSILKQDNINVNNVSHIKQDMYNPGIKNMGNNMGTNNTEYYMGNHNTSDNMRRDDMRRDIMRRDDMEYNNMGTNNNEYYMGNHNTSDNMRRDDMRRDDMRRDDMEYNNMETNNIEYYMGCHNMRTNNNEYCMGCNNMTRDDMDYNNMGTQEQDVENFKMTYEKKLYKNTGAPEVFGPPMWFTLHNGAARYPDNPSPIIKERMKNFILGIPAMVPCKKCREDATSYIERHKKDLDKIVSDKSHLFKFFVDFHNDVNKKLNKPIMSLKDAKKLYSGEVEILKLKY